MGDNPFASVDAHLWWQQKDIRMGAPHRGGGGGGGGARNLIQKNMPHLHNFI